MTQNHLWKIKALSHASQLPFYFLTAHIIKCQKPPEIISITFQNIFLDADDLAENFISNSYTLAKENNLNYITLVINALLEILPTSEPSNPASAKSSKENLESQNPQNQAEKRLQKPESTKSLEHYESTTNQIYKQLLDLTWL